MKYKWKVDGFPVKKANSLRPILLLKHQNRTRMPKMYDITQ